MTWTPTMQLRWRDYGVKGCELEQLWISSEGTREWREVQTVLNSQEEPAVAHAPANRDTANKELFS
jgi:hypothetical protein